MSISPNSGFEFGNFTHWGASAGAVAGIFGNGVGDGLHHEDGRRMFEQDLLGVSPSNYFGAITIPTHVFDTNNLIEENLDIQFTANAGDTLKGSYFLMVGANAQTGGDYAAIRIRNNATGFTTEILREVATAGNTNGPGNPGGGYVSGWDGDSGNWQAFPDWTAPTTGSFTFQGIVAKRDRNNATNANYRTSIGLDNIRLLQSPTALNLSNTQISEVAAPNSIIGTFSTIDPDFESDDVFTYSLVSGTGSSDNSKFTIVGNQMRTAANFNYETDNSQSIRVRTTDEDNRSLDRIFTISVLNAAPGAVTSGDSGTGAGSHLHVDNHNHALSWNSTDPNGGPFSVSAVLRRNGSIFTTSTAQSGTFTILPGHLLTNPTTFTLTVTVTDAGGLSDSDTRSVVIADDDADGPSITLTNAVNQLDSANNVVSWSISDPSGVSSRNVLVRRVSNNQVVKGPNTTSNSDSFDLNDLAPDTYRIEATATDADNDRSGDATSRTASATFTISDDDTAAPTIELGGSEGAQTDDQPQAFTWTISDASGIAGRLVKVTRNGSVIFCQNTSDSGTFNFDTEGPGEYVIEVSATDADEDWGTGDRTTAPTETRSVTVNDDDSAGPEITIGNGSLSDGEDNFFNWSVTDPSGISALSVKISKDGTEIYPLMPIIPPLDGSFDLNPYGSGTYTICVDATDNDSDHADDKARTVSQRTIVIADDDTVAPTIDITSGSSSDGENNFFKWTVTDASGVYDADVRITRDDEELYFNTYAPTGCFDLNPEGLGDFTITIDAIDNDNDAPGDRLSASATQSTAIFDDDTVAPEITLGGSLGSQSHGVTQAFTWSIADASGLKAAAIEVRKNSMLIFSSTEPSGIFNFDDRGLGTFEICVSATDADEDWSGDTLSAEATRSVVVTNATPNATADETETNEDTATTIDILANDSDDDPNEEFSVTVDTTGTLGSVTINDDNTITYDPQGAFQHLALGEEASDSFSYTIDDGFGGTDVALVTITITGENDGPVVAAAITANETEDGASFSVGLLQGASDPDTSDELNVADLTLVSGNAAGVEIGANSLTINPSAYNHLAVGESEVITYSYNVIDGNGGSVAQTATITIGGLNDAATISGTASGTTDEDSTTNVTGTLAVSDVDDGEAVFTPQTSVAGTYGAFSIDASGNWTYTLDNSTVQNLNAGDSVTDSFTVASVDGTASEVVMITIGGLNDAPVLSVPADLSIVENASNGTIVGTISASDVDQSDILTYSIISGSGAAVFAIDSASGEIVVADSTLLDFESTPQLTLQVRVEDGEGGSDTAIVTIDLINQASISGVVFVDVNLNGAYDADEPGVDGVVVELRDSNGNPVLDAHGAAITAITSDGGFYLLEDLDPNDYQLHESQPTGVDDGTESLGSLGGAIVANDVMQLSLVREDAFDYAFAELGQQVTAGDTANNGFWQNKHGQSLIVQGGPALAQWLTNNFSNVFGNSLDGADGQDVADFYREQLFKQKGPKSAGPAKVDANFMGLALATFFTSRTLAGEAGAAYGFNVSDTGIGTKVVNVGTSGAAFNVQNGTDRTILQLLLATNDLTDLPDGQAGFAYIYDQNGDGIIDADESQLRTMAHELYTAINEGGGV